jgi:uncharacterized protein
MPTARRSSSCSEAAPVLIAALSGRALAAAATRARERVIVLDRFADSDTVRSAECCVALPRSGQGFARAPFVAAVRRFAGQVRGLVYGAGFEHDPDLLAELACLVPIMGNQPEVVAAVKEPLGLAALLRRLGLPHPETTRETRKGDGWLRKLVGGSGGSHVAPAGNGPVDRQIYFQRRVCGQAVSAAFLSDGHSAQVLGFSEQWCAGDAAAPFRYGGSAGPVSLSPGLANSIADACNRLAAATGLVGLNGLDLLVEGDRFHVIEINPRPGATLDVFDGRGAPALWRLHCEGVAGHLPERVETIMGAVRAAAIVYAPQRVSMPRSMTWPVWTADRGAAGTVIDRGEPVCTVFATAATAAAARAAVERRAQRFLAQLLECQYPHL